MSYLDKEQKPDSHWYAYGQTIETYMDDFSSTKGTIFKEALDAIADRPDPVLIDLMAPTTALRTWIQNKALLNLNTMQAPIKALAVGYEDRRTSYQRYNDHSLGIDYISGDLRMPSTWVQIRDWLGEHKATMVMQRSIAGIDNLPCNRHFYNTALREIWSWLDPQDGVAALQTHSLMDLNKAEMGMNSWSKMLSAKNIQHDFNFPSYIPSFYTRFPSVVIKKANFDQEIDKIPMGVSY